MPILGVIKYSGAHAMNEHEAKEFACKVRAKTEKLKKDPLKARQFLQRAGIVDREGKLAEYYRPRQA